MVCHGHMLSLILIVKKLLELFTKKNCKKQIEKHYRGKKVIKKNGYKLYVILKGYDNFSNSWIDI